VSERAVVGLKPWLPWPLSRWSWWTEPVRAERLAALRIGVAAVLLLDLLTTYLPRATDFYGANSLGSPDIFPATDWDWSLLRKATDQRLLLAALGTWILATAALLVGVATRVAVVTVWVLSTSFAHLNPAIENAGDEVRGILLFYLMLSPCGAAWSLDSRRLRRDDVRLIWPWALRLLFVQMVLIYFSSGVYKLLGAQWRAGESLYYVLSDWTFARCPYAALPIPYLLTQLLTWSVLAWELAFPLLVMIRRTRVIALLFGVTFHLGIGLFLELGMFTPYMLCLYLPLVPWERWADRLTSRVAAPVAVPSPGAD
jgi:hypothetical protein